MLIVKHTHTRAHTFLYWKIFGYQMSTDRMNCQFCCLPVLVDNWQLIGRRLEVVWIGLLRTLDTQELLLLLLKYAQVGVIANWLLGYSYTIPISACDKIRCVHRFSSGQSSALWPVHATLRHMTALPWDGPNNM